MINPRYLGFLTLLRGGQYWVITGGQFSVDTRRELVQSIPEEGNSPKLRYYSKQIRIQNLPGYRALVSHSHLVNLLRKSYANYLNRKNIQTKFGLPHTESVKESDWLLTTMILTRWIEDCRHIQARPVILYIPTVENVKHDQNIETRALDLNRKMQGFAAEHDHLLLINLQAAFAKYPHPETLYLQDGHLNPKGHMLTAEVMRHALRL